MLDARGNSRAVKIAVFGALAYDLTSANLSSPQTFELNAGQRAPTLDKWLRMNVIEAMAWGVGGSLIDGSLDPLIGTTLGITSMYVKYRYAIKAGQQSGLPDMENHQTGEYDGGNNSGV